MIVRKKVVSVAGKIPETELSLVVTVGQVPGASMMCATVGTATLSANRLTPVLANAPRSHLDVDGK